MEVLTGRVKEDADVDENKRRHKSFIFFAPLQNDHRHNARKLGIICRLCVMLPRIASCYEVCVCVCVCVSLSRVGDHAV